MANEFILAVNLKGHIPGVELQNISLEKLSADPTGGDLYEGRIWLNTTTNLVKQYVNSTVQEIATTSTVFGASNIGDGTVTLAKITDSTAESKILGRGQGSGAGDYQELSLGTNISISGTTINVSSGTATVGDADYGDITVSSSGATWTVDNQAITYAKIQNITATDRLLGRLTAGAGVVEEITVGSTLAKTGTTLDVNVGTGANQIVQLDGTSKLPAVDGSQLTNISGGTTNLAFSNQTSTTADVTSNTGTDATLTGATTSLAGLMVAADKTKLDGIENSADVTDATNVVSSLNGATITTATVATGDKVLIQDIDDSNNLKTVTAQSIADLASGTSITVKDEGSNITTSLASIDFTGSGVTASAVGNDVTVNITSGSVSDGDKGDITVSASGATWTIDNQAVTYAKIQDITATDRLLGRLTAGAGTTEEITIGSTLSKSGTTLDVNVGTGANQIVQLDGTSKLPAVDGSQLTNLPSGTVTTSYQNSNFNASEDTHYIIDTSSNPVTATLPASPSNYARISFCDGGWNFSTNIFTINNNGKNIGDFNEVLILTNDKESVSLIFISVLDKWIIEDSNLNYGSSPTQSETLTADRTYYVRTDGSDSNNGLADTNIGAFLTIQKAIDVACTVNKGLYNITIQVGNGTYTTPLVLKKHYGDGTITIKGDSTTPSNVVISTTNANCINGDQVTNWIIDGFELQTTTAGSCIYIDNLSALNIKNLDFGSCASFHIHSFYSSILNIIGNYTISGTPSGLAHGIIGYSGAIYCVGQTVTVINTPSWPNGFVYAYWQGTVSYANSTFTGSATGKYYTAAIGGHIRGSTNGNFPGNTAGSTATGGYYST